MKSEVQRLIEAPGIVAAAKTDGAQTQVLVSEGDARRWQPLLAAASHVLDVSHTDEVKIALEKYSVVAVRSGTVTLGVVVVKSHPVIKSLKRMIRRAFRRLGSTMPEARQHVAVPTPSTPTAPTNGDPAQFAGTPTRLPADPTTAPPQDLPLPKLF